MAVTRKKKEQTLTELEDKIGSAKSIIFADYRGTTVKKITELRTKMRKENIYAKVAKITLIRKALAKRGIDVSLTDFKAPIAIMASQDDEVAPARVLSEFTKENKNIQVRMGIMDGKILTVSEVGALAALPGKQELRGKLVRTIVAPVSGFVNVLSGNLKNLVYVLSAIKNSRT